MGFAVIYSRATEGIKAPAVSVETHISNGMPKLNIVGLPETAVKESKERVRSALLNSQFVFPSRRITINLAPADLPKEGGRFDLPIALGILAASEQIPKAHLSEFEFAGELALNGELRPIQGCLPFAIATRDSKRNLMIPVQNADEALLPDAISVFCAKHLLEICAHFCGKETLTPQVRSRTVFRQKLYADLIDVHHQQHAKRALEIAGTGQHSLLMIGPPGTGKTMLATRLVSILPPMSEQEALEVAAIHSISGKGIDIDAWRIRPFRAPHHTASGVALVGGGSPPRPGEISLAHRGILFLDELPEFNRHVLETLREPLESGQITISRASYQAQFPAQFQLVAAMNPCPCGYLGDVKERCQCTAEQVRRYHYRVSRPILDRIDINIEVPTLPKGALSKDSDTIETSATVRSRIEKARTIQLQRANKLNAFLTTKEIKTYCTLKSREQNVLDDALDKLNLSARAYHKILKVARTIADLGESHDIQTPHLIEAISYRRLD